MEYKDQKYRLKSELFFISIFSIEITFHWKDTNVSKLVHNPAQAPYASILFLPIIDSIEIARQIMVYFLVVFNFGFSQKIVPFLVK